jgi:hypothetical protein
MLKNSTDVGGCESAFTKGWKENKKINFEGVQIQSLAERLGNLTRNEHSMLKSKLFTQEA